MNKQEEVRFVVAPFSSKSIMIYSLMYQKTINLTFFTNYSGWGCRIHQLHLWYDSKQSDGEVPVMLPSRNVEYPFIAIAPRSFLAQSGSTW